MRLYNSKTYRLFVIDFDKKFRNFENNITVMPPYWILCYGSRFKSFWDILRALKRCIRSLFYEESRTEYVEALTIF